MGRRKRLLPTDGLEIIRKLGARGVRESDIWKALGLSYKSWSRIKRENDEARLALEEARMMEHDDLYGVLYDKAVKGDSTAAMFLLKTRHGYKEGAEQVTANQVNVKITLPSSMRPEQYAKSMEVNSND
jgi:hypothetical protein